jgi:hypothetical protein
VLDDNGESPGRLTVSLLLGRLFTISAGSTITTERVLNCPVEEYHDLSPGRLFEFYNVLWVERNNGVAYRGGIDRILKTIWERQATEIVDITLG